MYESRAVQEDVEEEHKYLKMNNFKQVYHAHVKQLNEFGGGGFSGQGTPEQSDGPDTSDRVTEDDINGRLGEISSQMRTLDTWIDTARTTDLFDEDGDYDLGEVWDDLDRLQRVINGIVGKYDVEESMPDDRDFEDDEARSTAGLSPFSSEDPS